MDWVDDTMCKAYSLVYKELLHRAVSLIRLGARSFCVQDYRPIVNIQYRALVLGRLEHTLRGKTGRADPYALPDPLSMTRRKGSTFLGAQYICILALLID